MRKLIIILVLILATILVVDVLLVATLPPPAREKNLRVIFSQEIEDARRLARSLDFGNTIFRPEIPPESTADFRHPAFLLVELRDHGGSRIAQIAGSIKGIKDYGYLQLNTPLPTNIDRVRFNWFDPEKKQEYSVDAVQYDLPVQSSTGQKGVVRFVIDLQRLQEAYPDNHMILRPER
jgi:hypothetical protein